MIVAHQSQLTSTSSNLSQWYVGGHANKSAILPAQAAFEEGTRIFSQLLTKDPRKRQLLAALQPDSLQDVLSLVIQAQARYHDRKHASGLRSALTSLSQRLHYYSNVVDVFASINPEYTALAWGLMKLLFGGIVEHDKTNSVLFTALNDLADSLPTVELAVMLFPTIGMQEAVAKLYSCIIKLLLRALKWYEEGKFAHAFHAITRPVALRYSDLINECKTNTEKILKIANISSQVEVRDMHLTLSGLQQSSEQVLQTLQDDRYMIKDQLSALTTVLDALRIDLAGDRARNMAAHNSIQNRLSDMQFLPSVGHISSLCAIDHKAILDSMVSKSGRQRRAIRVSGVPFWMSPKLAQWNTSAKSSSILVKATFQERFTVSSFCLDIIQQLISSNTVVLYILQDQDRLYSLHDILKSLILQCLGQNTSTANQSTYASTIHQFHAAQLDEDFLVLLGRILEHYRLVFIIVNAESMQPDTAIDCRRILRDLSRRLSDAQANTVLRILNTSQSPKYPADTTVDDSVLKVGGVRGRRQQSRLVVERRQSKQLTGTSGPLAIMWRNHKRSRAG